MNDNDNNNNNPLDSDMANFFNDEPSGYLRSNNNNNGYNSNNPYGNPRNPFPYQQQPQQQYGNIPQTPQQPFNRQYAEQPKKKSPTGMIVILIAVIVFFAVVIVAMSTVMKAMIDKGDTKPVQDTDNITISENDDEKEKEKETTTDTATVKAVQTTKVTSQAVVEVIPETVTVTVEVEKPTQKQQTTTAKQQTKVLYDYTVYNYSLPIYDKPSYDGKVIGRIEDRGTYSIVDETDHWGKLSTGGWIDFDTSGTPGYMVDVGYGYVATKSDPLNLRYTPDNNSKVLDTIPKGTKLSLYEIAVDGWYFTSYNGNNGFVSADYISFDTYENYSSYVPDMCYYACVTTKSDPLNLRSSPDKNSSILTTIPKDTYIYVYTTSYSDWYYTTYNGKSGFVSASFITLMLSGDGYYYDESDYIEGHNGEWATVVTKSDPLNMRSEPSKNASIITSIPKGSSIYVRYSLYQSDWCYAEWGNYSGYVNMNYLAF